MKSRRVGRFFVSRMFLDLENIAARRLMSEIVVLEASYSFMRMGVEYTALCEQFAECEEGSFPFNYDVELHGDPVQVRFVKIV